VADVRGSVVARARDDARTYGIYLQLSHGELHALPGAREFVDACRTRGLAIAVASGADAVKVEANLREVGLSSNLFAAIIDGTQIVRKKPAPDIFLEACRRLGLRPASCLVIEDAVAGVAAAKAAGTRCLALMTSFDAEQLA